MKPFDQVNKVWVGTTDKLQNNFINISHNDRFSVHYVDQKIFFPQTKDKFCNTGNFNLEK